MAYSEAVRGRKASFYSPRRVSQFFLARRGTPPPPRRMKLATGAGDAPAVAGSAVRLRAPAPPRQEDAMSGIRRPDFYRGLNPPEQALARKVFGDSLPPWREIGIGNGLGFGGDPWTASGPMNYSQMP